MKQRNKRSFGQRALAWLLAVAFVLSGMNVTSWKVEAAGNLDLTYAAGKQTVTLLAGKTDYDVNFEGTESYNTIQELIDAGYKKMSVVYSVSGVVTSAYPGAQTFVSSTPDAGETWPWSKKAWSNIGEGGYTIGTKITKTGTATLDFSDADGKSNKLGNFGVQFCGFEGELEYTITSAKLIYSGSSSGGATGEVPESLEGLSAKVISNPDEESNQYYREYFVTITNNSGVDVSGVTVFVPTTGNIVCGNAYGFKTKYSEEQGGILVYYSGVVPNGTTLAQSADRKFGVKRTGAGDTSTVTTGDVSVISVGADDPNNADFDVDLSEDNTLYVTPYEMHGALHVNGTTLVDQNDNPVQLRGISTHGLQHTQKVAFKDYVNESAFKEIRDKWGIELVRLAVYTEENGYCGSNKDSMDATIQKGVQLATDLGMYVLLDWHILSDGNPQLHEAEAKTFFEKYANMYKNNDHVLYELCNEPNGTSWDTNVKPYAKNIIPIIRKYDEDAIIIVGTTTWSQDVNLAANNPITKGDIAETGTASDLASNVMYTIHFYASEDSHKDTLRAKVSENCNKIPIFCTEFGICAASGDGTYDLESANEWISLLDENNISYTCWNFTNQAEASAIFDSSCMKTDGGWLGGDLSTTGRWLVPITRAASDAEQAAYLESIGQEVPKKTVTAFTFPTASQIAVGAALSTVKLTGASFTAGGTVTPKGTFAFKTPTVKPEVGKTNYAVVYTPTEAELEKYDFSDVTGYDAESKTITQNVSVTVKEKDKTAPVITVPAKVSVTAGSTYADVIEKIDAAKKTGDTAGTFTIAGVTDMTKALAVSDSGEITIQFEPTDSKNYSSAEKKIALEVTKSENTVKPAKPTVVKKTSTSVTLKAVSGVEYGVRVAGVTGTFSWQSENEFTALDSYQSYEFVVRTVETASQTASPSSDALLVTTYKKASDCYQVDLDSLDKAGYVDAFVVIADEQSHATISYDAETKTLTLLDDKAYEITGNRDDVTIVSKSTKVTFVDATVGDLVIVLEEANQTETIVLDDATVKSIKNTTQSTDLVIKLDGENAVENGILNRGNLSIQNLSDTKTGTLTVNSADGTGNAVSVKDFTLVSGGLTVSADNGAAISADGNVLLAGGELNANNTKGTGVVVSNKNTLDKTTIANYTEGMFDPALVDLDGNPITDFVHVTYKDGDVTKVVSLKKVDGEVTFELSALSGKDGSVALGWKIDGDAQGTVLPAQSSQTIAGDTTYVAVYQLAEGTLALSVGETPRLVYGYAEDRVSVLTVKNGLNVPVKEVAFKLVDGDKYFTLTNLKTSAISAGETAANSIELKKDLPAGEYAAEVEVSCKELGTATTSITVVRHVDKANQTKPDAPTALESNITESQITLDAVDGVQYGIMQGSKFAWQSSNVFAGLEQDTEYTFALLLPGDENHNEAQSDASTLKTKKTVDNPIVDPEKKDIFEIDISKLSDSKYVDSISNTAQYDAKTNTLKLTQEGTYTIENSDATYKNDDLKIVTLKDATVILKGVTIGGVKTEGAENDKVDLTIQISGDVTIGGKNESATQTAESVISSTGKLVIESADEKSKLTVEGNDNAPAVNANDIVISTGNVVVNAGKDASAMKAETVTIGEAVGSVLLNATGDKPAVEVSDQKNFKNDAGEKVKVQNGEKYVSDKEGQGGSSGAENGGSSNNNSSSSTSGSGSNTTANGSDTTEEFVPDLIATKLLIQKGKSYTIKTNDASVIITKISYVNSKSKKIVKVSSNGKVKAKKIGTAKLNVTIAYNGTSNTKTVSVKVQKNPVVVIDKAKQTVSLKKKKKLTIVKPINMQSAFAMKFKTSSKKIATVTKKGIVTAKKKGKATITVTWRDTKYKVVIKVK